MKPDASKNSDREYNLQDLFDEILARHLERLIGTRHGIDALSLNSINISCLIMLAERENEIDNPSERYTVETISAELEEIGFDINENMDLIIQEMIQKGYIQIENGGIIPQKPATSMCQLLDKVFPGMIGMNLVAYFIQTIDEVHSDRKDLESAVSRLDQILKMHGVSLQKDAGQPQKKVAPQAVLKKTIEPAKRPKVENRIKRTPASTSGPRILSSGYYTDKTEIKKVNFGRVAPPEDDPAETAPDTYAGIEPEELQLHDQETEVAEDMPSEEIDTNLQDASTGSESAEQETDLDESVDSKEPEGTTPFKDEAMEAEEAMPETDAGSETEAETIDDDFIENRIAAFEDDLAMECPTCRKAKVQAEKTARGKSYYKCSSKTCNFISWGIPHHILCPRCNNPFLIESNKADKTILKCPRATCRHWQIPPWELPEDPPERIDSALPKSEKVAAVTRKPRRRVKKRRVVRRKK